jgi:hypothetical protein
MCKNTFGVKLMFDKDFLIYKKKITNLKYKDNFQNENRLGKAGKQIFTAFLNMRDTSPEGFQNMNKDVYFDEIDEIYITSQQRRPDQDAYINSHTRDLAVDFYIKPVYLMPYYAGKLFKSFQNNVYIANNNGHIHFDIDPDKGQGRKYQKSVMVETEITAKTGEIFPIKDKIDSVLSFYGVNTPSISRKASNIENATKEMLLDTSPIKLYIGPAQSKLDMKIEKAVTENPYLSAIGNGIDLLQKNKQAITTGFIVLILVIIAMKFIPDELQKAMIKKLQEQSSGLIK